MARSFLSRKRRRKKTTSFNPTHDFVDHAVQDFLNQGGTIKKIDSVKSSYEGFISLREQTSPADDFLMGN